MKIIAFDIDGTTINRLRNVTSKTLRTLKSLKEAGFILVPTTGRCYNEMPKCFKDCDLCDFAITSNGAIITDISSGTILFQNEIPMEVVYPILKSINTREWMISVHKNQEVYDTSNTLRYLRRILFHKDLKVAPKIENLDYFLKDTRSVEKLQLTTRSHQDMDRFVKLIKTETNLEMPISRGRYIEITNQGVHKLSGVSWLCNHLGTTLESVIAIGDDMNDLELISSAGIGIAMGNANELVKSHADFITKTNRNNGFYIAMKKYFPDNIKF